MRFDIETKAPRLIATLCFAGVASALGMAQVQAAGMITIMQSEPPRSMDPADQTATFTGDLLDPMYEGLVARGQDFKVHPKLATKWSVSSDGLTWTFELRHGVHFHDGSVFDAAAAVKSFDRLMDAKLGLAGAGQLAPMLKSAQATGPYTLQIVLTHPYPAFLDLLTTNQAQIVSPVGAAKGNIGRVADGTGPFKFVEWNSGNYVLEKANPDYWGPKPSTDELKWTWSTEQSVMNMALQSGDVDVINPVPPVFAASIKANPDFTLIAQSGSAVFWLALNVQLAPLDKVKVRQALNYATDREALVKALLHGFGTPADSPLPPIPPYHLNGEPPYSYDIAKAKALLKEAGVPDGFTISVAVQEQSANIAQALQGMWAKIGVNLKIEQLEPGVWTKAAFNDPAQKKADGLGSVIASWSSGGFDPDQQLRPLYATASWAPAGANLGFFSDKKFDAILDEAAAEPDQDKRIALYDEAQKIINTEAPMVLLYTTQDLIGVRKDISGVWAIPGGELQMSYAERSAGQ